ncbi:hypothetical protein [Chryseobacterium taihuense]|uniref:Uncharacterized protein n=1 Tax=Chryseobacterium taihuense TaxID=1141221 RepID=A0ABY0QTV8_9FLAO|nr:hypothetical protein [Chryseobacterium taihuense]SDL90096.1 hypothetical protein SAMN05216273_10885 [Chryseobacterium taihuense]
MRRTITTIALCIFVMTNISCRCDLEEDETENKKTDAVQKSK